MYVCGIKDSSKNGNIKNSLQSINSFQISNALVVTAVLAETDRKIYFLMRIAHSDYLDVEHTLWQSDMSYALILLQRRIA
jgi:hypothetical protein